MPALWRRELGDSLQAGMQIEAARLLVYNAARMKDAGLVRCATLLAPRHLAAYMLYAFGDFAARRQGGCHGQALRF